MIRKRKPHRGAVPKPRRARRRARNGHGGLAAADRVHACACGKETRGPSHFAHAKRCPVAQAARSNLAATAVVPAAYVARLESYIFPIVADYLWEQIVGTERGKPTDAFRARVAAALPPIFKSAFDPPTPAPSPASA